MYIRNDGKGESNITQNGFTAYLLSAVAHRKADYLHAKQRRQAREVLTDPDDLSTEEAPGISDPTDLLCCIENAALEEVLNRISERDRYSKKFREEHEEEILLHQAAKNAFDEMGVKKLPKVKELQTEYAKLLEEKKKTYAEYRRSREEMRELLTAKANVDRVLKMEVEQDVEKEKDHGQR